MDYDFFFSYSRGNYTSYLKKFFKDLCSEIREKKGYRKTDLVGFFDQEDIEFGKEWKESIVTGLQTSKVMICIYSPAYFNSIYCGKEWQFFQLRRKEYLKMNRLNNNSVDQLPPVIIPILWQGPLQSDLNSEVMSIQYTMGDPSEEHNVEGFRYIAERSRNKDFYKKYIRELAKIILDVADRYPVPSLTNQPSLEKISSAFTNANMKTIQKFHGNSTRPPKKVSFVYVAANPIEFNGCRSDAPYLYNGGGDWKPFFPVDKPIDRFVQQIVSSDEIGFVSDELPITHNLLREIERANDERGIVIILVDGWSINWKEDFRKILEDFDTNAKPSLNCSVFVITNNNDPFTVRQKTEIEQTIAETFRYRKRMTGCYFKSSINSMDEFHKTLGDVLIQIKSEMHIHAPIERPISSSIARPSVNNIVN